MDVQTLGKYVELVAPIMQHEEGYYNQHDKIYQVLGWFGIDDGWKEVIRVMAQGGPYYGADEWMTRYAG